MESLKNGYKIPTVTCDKIFNLHQIFFTFFSIVASDRGRYYSPIVVLVADSTHTFFCRI